VTLSEYIALGDWRLFFHARDQLDRIKAEQLDAAASKYFVRDNRVLGTFIPDDSPQRAVVPQAPSCGAVAGQFKPAGKRRCRRGLRPLLRQSRRRTRLQTFGDLKVALLPKRNRGQTVNVAMTFRWGDESSLRDRNISGALAMSMLTRGTRR
jgi:zinc protease